MMTTSLWDRDHPRVGIVSFVVDGFTAREVAEAGAAVRSLDMRFNAGHALNYYNVQPVTRLAAIRELHIGHAIVSRSVFVGLREAVREMKQLMRGAANPNQA